LIDKLGSRACVLDFYISQQSLEGVDAIKSMLLHIDRVAVFGSLWKRDYSDEQVRDTTAEEAIHVKR
jgi:hypothetical protein